MRRYSFTRQERKLQALAWFSIRIQHGNENFASAYEIARGLGMTASTHFKSILLEMVASGELEMRPRNKPGRWEGHEYMLSPGSYTYPKKHAVAVKSRGMVVGQLELFS